MRLNSMPKLSLLILPLGLFIQVNAQTLLYKNKKLDSLKKEKIRFAPTRIFAGVQKGYDATFFSIESEIKIINYLNIGDLTAFAIPKNGRQVYSLMDGLYLAPYLPINRVFNYNKKTQNKGLFLSFKVGYGIYNVIAPNLNLHDWGVISGVGIDYLFNRHFGLSITGDYFLNNYAPPIIQGGFSFKIR